MPTNLFLKALAQARRLAHAAGMWRKAFASTCLEVMQRTPGKYLATVRRACALSALELGIGLKQAARAACDANTAELSRT